MKRTSLILLAALALVPRTSGADNGCRMTDYPDHVEVNCEETATPEAPRTPPANTPPWPFTEAPADSTPYEPPPIEAPDQTVTPPIPQ